MPPDSVEFDTALLKFFLEEAHFLKEEKIRSNLLRFLLSSIIESRGGST